MRRMQSMKSAIHDLLQVEAFQQAGLCKALRSSRCTAFTFPLAIIRLRSTCRRHRRLEYGACTPLMIPCSPGNAAALAWRASSGPPSVLRALPAPGRCPSAPPCPTARAETSCPHARLLVQARFCNPRPGRRAGRPRSPLRCRPWRACRPAPPGRRTLRGAHARHSGSMSGQFEKTLKTRRRLGS